ncbi:MAG: hypothetical protein QM638_22340 [Nocardioides sp.]|uniref:PIN-like domain-containing protein n=1 Tax=Nocardioides sp. TaxID=35761 RepID=UPI0039E30015
MPAVASMVRFYVDESALGLGKTLEAARKDVIHVGHKLIPECPIGTPDPDWLKIVAQRSLVVIGRDKRIRSRPGEREVLREHGLRVLRIGGSQDLSTWEWLGRFVRHWHAIEELVEARPVGPWFYLVNSNGLVEVDL